GNYRNYQTLLNLVPGTTPARFQNAVTDTPARALSTNVNGTARNSNNTRLDGTVNVFIWLPHHAVYVAPAETVYTVNVSTDNSDGSGRTPFPGNRIPASRISPISAALQSRLPVPNGPGVSGNYTGTGPIDLKRNNFDGKLNYNVGSAAQVWGKYSQMNATVTSDMWLGNPQNGGAGGYGFGDGSGIGDTKVKLATLGTTWTLSPTVVLDGTLGLTRFDQECIPPDVGTNFGTDIFHIPGTNGDGLSAHDPRT